MTNLDSILKSRDITLPKKVHLVKAMVFLVVMYGCESWTTKKAECRRIDAFELWCWRRLLRVSWTARRSKQSILKEISPECSLEGLMLKLKPILWLLDAKSWFIWKDPDAGKDWRWEEKGTTEDEMVGWHHWLNGHEFELTAWVGDGQGGLTCCSMGSQRVGHDWATELNWTEPFRRQMENSLKREFFLMNWQLQSVHKKFRRSFLTNHLHCFSLWVLYSFLLSWLLFWLLSG